MVCSQNASKRPEVGGEAVEALLAEQLGRHIVWCASFGFTILNREKQQEGDVLKRECERGRYECCMHRVKHNDTMQKIVMTHYSSK